MNNKAFRFILGTRVDNTTYDATTMRILENCSTNGGGYICVANVHMIMEAMDNSSFRKIVNEAFVVTPDGMPVVWCLRWLGIENAERVYGPTLMKVICQKAAEFSMEVGFFGSTPDVLERLVQRTKEQFPSLDVVFTFSPPFRELSHEENKQIIDQINKSGTRILFVGLGCPKQEKWMGENKSQISAVMIGVGAAFDFLSGAKPQAPRWMQRIGLEWFFRFITEPKRLWKRYLYHNPRFLWYFLLQLVRTKFRND